MKKRAASCDSFAGENPFYQWLIACSAKPVTSENETREPSFA